MEGLDQGRSEPGPQLPACMALLKARKRMHLPQHRAAVATAPLHSCWLSAMPQSNTCNPKGIMRSGPVEDFWDSPWPLGQEKARLQAPVWPKQSLPVGLLQ